MWGTANRSLHPAIFLRDGQRHPCPPSPCPKRDSYFTVAHLSAPDLQLELHLLLQGLILVFKSAAVVTRDQRENGRRRAHVFRAELFPEISPPKLQMCFWGKLIHLSSMPDLPKHPSHISIFGTKRILSPRITHQSVGY